MMNYSVKNLVALPIALMLLSGCAEWQSGQESSPQDLGGHSQALVADGEQENPGPAEKVTPAVPLPEGVEEADILAQLKRIEFGDADDGEADEAATTIADVVEGLRAKHGAVDAIQAVLHVAAKHDLAFAGVTSVIERLAQAEADESVVIDLLTRSFENAEAITGEAIDGQGLRVSEEIATRNAKHLRVGIVNSVKDSKNDQARALLELAAASPTDRVRRAAERALGRDAE